MARRTKLPHRGSNHYPSIKTLFQIKKTFSSVCCALVGILIAFVFVTSCASTSENNPNLPQRPETAIQTEEPIQPENAYIELAFNYMTQNNFPAAFAELQKSESLSATNPELEHAYGIYYQRTGELDKSAQHFAKAVRKSPQNPRFNNNYGVLLSQTGKYQEALKRFSIAYVNEEYSNRAAAYENYADVKVKQGEFPEAVEFYQKAIEINSKWFVLELKIANSLYNQGEFGAAYTNFENYMNKINQLNILPSDQDIELGLAIAASVKDYAKMREYQEILQERTEQNL